MAQLTKENFYKKWVPLLADNEFQNINGDRFDKFLQDLRDTFGSADPDVANVPFYDAAEGYVRGYVVRYALSGQGQAFYFALKAGMLPAPTGLATDTNWQLVAGPTAATALSQAVTLAQAKGLLRTKTIIPGRLYAINFGADAQGKTRTVYLPGLSTSQFDIEGRLSVNNTLSRVLVDVAAGTLSPVASGGGGGGVAYDGLPGGPIELPIDGPQDIQIPAGLQLIAVWWQALQPEGDYIKVALLAACYSLSGTTLTLNDHIEGLLAGDTIDLSYSL
jgi:hypothetical protein